ncbi:MAG TPA: hypothetical protein PK782_11790 [Nitrospira sp.]|nr:hypothetical protein [Nitrospira sp.]
MTIKLPAIIPAIVLMSVVLSGCPLPRSEMYKGFSEAEKSYFATADLGVFPNDARKDVERYQASLVAWPGFITELNSIQKDSAYFTRIVVEHHYYDWILDHSIQKEKYFLSPRGEGVFTTLCPSKLKDENVTKDLNNMLIVYGKPEKVEDGMLHVTCDYAAFIKREWVRTDIFDYGRPGESVKWLNTPGPGAGTVLRKSK